MVCELDWSHTKMGNFPGMPIDVFIASDVVWLADLVGPLVTCLVQLIKEHQVSSQFILAHQQRSVRVDEKFFNKMEIEGFQRTVLQDDGHVKIFSFKQGSKK